MSTGNSFRDPLEVTIDDKDLRRRITCVHDEMHLPGCIIAILLNHPVFQRDRYRIAACDIKEFSLPGRGNLEQVEARRQMRLPWPVLRHVLLYHVVGGINKLNICFRAHLPKVNLHGRHGSLLRRHLREDPVVVTIKIGILEFTVPWCLTIG